MIVGEIIKAALRPVAALTAFFLAIHTYVPMYVGDVSNPMPIGLMVSWTLIVGFFGIAASLFCEAKDAEDEEDDEYDPNPNNRLLNYVHVYSVLAGAIASLVFMVADPNALYGIPGLVVCAGVMAVSLLAPEIERVIDSHRTWRPEAMSASLLTPNLAAAPVHAPAPVIGGENSAQEEFKRQTNGVNFYSPPPVLTGAAIQGENSVLERKSQTSVEMQNVVPLTDKIL